MSVANPLRFEARWNLMRHLLATPDRTPIEVAALRALAEAFYCFGAGDQLEALSERKILENPLGNL